MENYFHNDVGISIRPSVVFAGLDGSPTWDVANASFVAYRPNASGSAPTIHQSGSMMALGDTDLRTCGMYYADIWVPVPWNESYRGTWIVYMEGQILPDYNRAGTTVTFAVDRYSPGLVYDRIGAPVGSSISSDLAVVDGNVDTLVTRIPSEVAQKLHLVNGAGGITPPTDKGLWDALGDGTERAKESSLVVVDGNVDTLVTRVPSEVAQKIHLVDGSGDVTPPTNKGLWDALGDGTERAKESSVQMVDGVVDAVQERTDNLPDDPASTTDVTDAVSTLGGLDSRDLTDVYDLVETTEADIRGVANRDLTEIYDAIAASGSSGDVSLILGRMGDPSPSTLASLLTGMPASVWGYGARTLTSFGSLSSDVSTAVWAAGSRTLTGFGSLPSDVWAVGTRTLTGFGTLVSDVWSEASRTLTDFDGAGAEVWGYSPRTLTSFGSLDTAVAAAVWAYVSRSLTTFGTLVADVTTAVWANGSRTLTSFSGAGEEVWGHTSRTLTAISAELAASVWNVLASVVGGSGTMGQKLFYILDGAGAAQYGLFDPSTDSLADIRQTSACAAATGSLEPWADFSS